MYRDTPKSVYKHTSILSLSSYLPKGYSHSDTPTARGLLRGPSSGDRLPGQRANSRLGRAWTRRVGNTCPCPVVTKWHTTGTRHGSTEGGEALTGKSGQSRLCQQRKRPNPLSQRGNGSPKDTAKQASKKGVGFLVPQAEPLLGMPAPHSKGGELGPTSAPTQPPAEPPHGTQQLAAGCLRFSHPH